MGIFARLATLIKSNLNDLISRSEDPEKMLNQVAIDMANQLIEAKKQVAVSIADEKRLAKQAEQEAANAAEWERRAMLAIKSGDDALAKEALKRKMGVLPPEEAKPEATAPARIAKAPASTPAPQTNQAAEQDELAAALA